MGRFFVVYSLRNSIGDMPVRVLKYLRKVNCSGKPLSVTMNELNGNEKYHYLSTSLPTAAYQPGTIRFGNLMLYGNNCVVLFYETFDTSYSYTRLGAIDNPSGLSPADFCARNLRCRTTTLSVLCRDLHER